MVAGNVLRPSECTLAVHCLRNKALPVQKGPGRCRKTPPDRTATEATIPNNSGLSLVLLRAIMDRIPPHTFLLGPLRLVERGRTVSHSSSSNRGRQCRSMSRDLPCLRRNLSSSIKHSTSLTHRRTTVELWTMCMTTTTQRTGRAKQIR
jgi:hypothetical protein